MSAFENFVNVELPSRPWITVPVSGSLTAGAFMQATGVGMALQEAYPTQLNQAPAASAAYSGVWSQGTVGEGVVFGDILYLKSDGKYWKGLGVNTNPTYPAQVMAVGVADANATVAVLHVGYARLDSWNFSAGAIFISPMSAGAIAQTQPSVTGQIVQVLGFAVSAHVVFFNANQVWVELA